VSDRTLGPVLINGVAHDASAASVSVFDIGFQRGYGCFEAMRVYGGTAFRLDDHLDRLDRSAEHLRIGLPPRADLRAWCTTVAAQGAPTGGGVLRVYVTGGTDPKHPGTDNRIVAFLEPLPDVPPSVRLDVLDAPWHADGRSSELTGAKTLSYGPNLAATIAARSRGFDDAALVGDDDVVLEGPTFSLGWVTDGTICTPALDSHILASITREAAIEVARKLDISVREERFLREDLLAADEVFVMSTVREILPAVAVGDRTLDPGPITAALRNGFHELVAAETR
jgi:branched-subunit amino acid aminotransferase/4-amino-4-deoxychorismate lyase